VLTRRSVQAALTRRLTPTTQMKDVADARYSGSAGAVGRRAPPVGACARAGRAWERARFNAARILATHAAPGLERGEITVGLLRAANGT
jgi:hypothetical protein